MVRKELKRKLLMGVSTLAVLVSMAGTCNMVAYASESFTVEASSDEGIVPHSDIIEYRYKLINGDLYRRLYNYTQEYWIGEWELIVEGNH
jgi:hypothetical protein